MKKILLLSFFLFSVTNTYAGETTGTISTGVSTDSGLNFQIPCNPSIVTNGSVNSVTCVITCNSGYSLSGNSCVVVSSSSGGGGGGGGGSFYTPNSYTNSGTTTTLNGSGNTIINTNLVIQINNIIDIKNLSHEQVVNNFFTSLNDLKSKISIITNGNSSLEKLLLDFENKINLSTLETYTKYDKTNLETYNKVYNNLYLFIKNVDLYYKTKDEKYKKEFETSYKDLTSLTDSINLIEKKYVVKGDVYKIITQDKKVSDIFNKVELLIVQKLDKLSKTGKLTKEQYKSSLENYNNLLVYFSIYSKEKNKEALVKARNYFLELYKTIK